MKLGLRSDPDDLARIAEDLQLHVYKLWNTFEDDLARLYLSDVSPIVIRDFQHALGSWRAATKDAHPERFTVRFRQLAALFTDADRVIRRLAAQPWRELQALPTSPTVSAAALSVPNVSLTPTSQRNAVSEGMVLGLVVRG